MAKSKEAKSTAVVPWQQELAEQTKAAVKSMESVATGQFFSTRAGVLSWAGNPLPNNQMGVVIADGVFEHAFYEGDFDSDNPTSPVCFAFGRDEAAMAPHEKSTKPQAEKCAGCPNNVFGSAEKGRGKACKNMARLALLPAGQFNAKGEFELDDDPAHYQAATPGYYRVSVTSVKGYAAHVLGMANLLERPPHAVVTKIKVIPDAKNQFKSSFETLMPAPDELMPVLMARHKELADAIMFPYQPPSDEAPEKGKPPKQGRGKGKY